MVGDICLPVFCYHIKAISRCLKDAFMVLWQESVVDHMFCIQIVPGFNPWHLQVKTGKALVKSPRKTLDNPDTPWTILMDNTFAANVGSEDFPPSNQV